MCFLSVSTTFIWGLGIEILEIVNLFYIYFFASTCLFFLPSEHISSQIVLFGVMPTWTDLMGAGLVLGTVASITFEKTIVEKCNIKRLCGGEVEQAEDTKKGKSSS